MLIAKVVANVVSTIKTENLEGRKLFMVQPIDEDGNEFGDELLAGDGLNVGAGIGDIVVVIQEGSSARELLGIDKLACPEVVIGGIVDFVDTYENNKRLKL